MSSIVGGRNLERHCSGKTRSCRVIILMRGAKKLLLYLGRNLRMSRERRRTEQDHKFPGRQLDSEEFMVQRFLIPRALLIPSSQLPILVTVIDVKPKCCRKHREKEFAGTHAKNAAKRSYLTCIIINAIRAALRS
jgi:hypothetical protein